MISFLNLSKPTIIIGIPDDKDYIGVAEEMSKDEANIVLTKSQNPHYIFTEKQASVLKEKGIKSIWIPDIHSAIEYAKNLNQPIIILGTTSVVSEVKILQQSRTLDNTDIC